MGGTSSSLLGPNPNKPLQRENPYELIESEIKFDDLQIEEKILTPIELEQIKNNALINEVNKEQKDFSNRFSNKFQKLTDLLQTTMILNHYSDKNKVIIKALKEEVENIKSNSKEKDEVNRSKIMSILQNNKQIEHYYGLTKFLILICIVLFIVSVAQIIMIMK